MKLSLPQTSKNIKGFTLIELLVVIAIIAILAVVGITVFSGQQATARDGRRRADIQAIAAALEANKTPNTSTYNALATTNFAAGIIPVDTNGQSYNVSVVANVANPTAWTAGAPSPSNPASYVPITTTIPANGTGTWKICALLEGTGTTTPNVYCLTNAQ